MDWTDDQLQHMTQEEVYRHINNGDMSINQYRRSKGWPEIPTGDRPVEKYSDLDRHDMRAPRFEQFDTVTDVSIPDAKKETKEDLRPEFFYGVFFGMAMATVFWGLFAFLLWLILR